MAKRRPELPDLPDTGRRYLDDTLRARLASPGVERFRRPGGSGARLALGVVLAAALLGTMLWLAR